MDAPLDRLVHKFSKCLINTQRNSIGSRKFGYRYFRYLDVKLDHSTNWSSRTSSPQNIICDFYEIENEKFLATLITEYGTERILEFTIIGDENLLRDYAVLGIMALA